MNVLIADDNVDFCQNLKRIVEQLGYSAATAFDGIEAVEKASEKKLDLIIMDIKMPNMDGVEAFKKIKEISPKTPVVLITAYATDAVIEEALRDGAFGCLHKPLDFEDFLSIFKSAINGEKRVLIADDNKELTANMKLILEAKGYYVDVANNGAIAIQKSQEKKYDVIILDIKMPYFNGPAAFREIRNIRPDAVFILITGLGPEGAKTADDLVKQSAYTWLEKPVDIDRLLALLERINEQKALGKLEKPGNTDV